MSAREPEATQRGPEPPWDADVRRPIWLVWALEGDGRTSLRAVCTTGEIAARYRIQVLNEADFFGKTLRVYVESRESNHGYGIADTAFASPIRKVGEGGKLP